MNWTIRTLVYVLVGANVLEFFGAWSYASTVVRLTGHLNRSVVFTFYKPDTRKPTRALVVDFVVSERTEDGRWSPVWSIVSSGELLGQVRYGECPAGFKQAAAPKKLSAGATYAVFVSDGSGGYGGSSYFGFKRDGSIVTLSSPDEHP